MEGKRPSQIDEAFLVVKNAIDGAYDFFSRVKNFHSEKEVDEILEYYSASIDQRILASEKEHGWNFVSGQLLIVYCNEAAYEIRVELYYQDAQERWMKEKSSLVKPMKSLKPKSAAELRMKKSIIFEIEEPKCELKAYHGMKGDEPKHQALNRNEAKHDGEEWNEPSGASQKYIELGCRKSESYESAKVEQERSEFTGKSSADLQTKISESMTGKKAGDVSM